MPPASFQLSYAIGVAHPLSVSIFHYGTSQKSEKELLEIVFKNFDLRPGVIVRYPRGSAFTPPAGAGARQTLTRLVSLRQGSGPEEAHLSEHRGLRALWTQRLSLGGP